MREFTEDEKFAILDMGALNYNTETCSLILEIATDDLIDNDAFNRLMKRGSLL